MGRLKDLIIIGGRNYYPQDIEQTVEQSHPALRPNCSAAFSVDVDGTLWVVVAAEVERQALKSLDVDAAIENIREAVWSEYELQVYGVLLLKTGSIPKTASGKIQRHACWQGFVDGSLNVVGSWQQGVAPGTPVASAKSTVEMSKKLRGDGSRVHRKKVRGYRLSEGQKALWFLYKLDRFSWAYNIILAVRICSRVDVVALRGALQALVDRHESLRTTYRELDGEPLQLYEDDFDLPWTEIDGSCWNAEELKAKVTDDARRPFNLEESAFRVSLFTREATDHVLLLAVHHIASDLWSMSVLMDELKVLYMAEKSAQKSPEGISLPPLPLSYTDWVRKQNSMLAGDRGEQMWNYWRQELGTALDVVLDLPTDKPRPPVQTYNGATHNFKLSQELTGQLRGLAQESNVTLYMLLLAAFIVLLYRYTGQSDIMVGCPTSGRMRPELQKMVGYLVNPVVLRADMSGNPTFAECIARVRQKVLGAIRHQEYPFGLLVEKLQPQRDPSRSPLFDVMFVLQQAQSSGELAQMVSSDEKKTSLKWGELELGYFEISQEEGQFDLTLETILADRALRGAFKYNTDLFSSGTIERMAGHFGVLLEAIVGNPEARVDQLPLLSELERHQLLVEWNDTATDYPSDKCIHELFDEQVSRTPDAVAVVFEESQLTYRELNSRANKLAHYLRSLGVGPEVLVGLCVERSLDAIVAMLGIIKAGGAYVPIDPDYPQDRIAYILSDARVPVLITQSRRRANLPEHRAVLVCLDTDWQAIDTCRSDNLKSEVKSTSLAYVIYTSGSTGKPKGVAVVQQAISRLVFETNYLQLQPTDCMAQASNISFDAATFEIWGALLHGAKLVGINREVMLSPEALANQLRKQKITILFVTTALFNQLVSVVPDIFQPLSTLLFGGEAVDPSVVATVLEKGPPWRLLHLYGPTESTTFSTVYLVESVPAGATNLPIGSPISNTTIYVLDRHRQPVPMGIPGELYIGGDGLARGYLNRSELTAARFIDNPFGRGRLYKTGDLVRYLPDGNIGFLGRIDNQVKIRGFRIELGEIEATLAQHPCILQAVVIAREDIPGDKRLVAYIVGNTAPTARELRDFLKAKLPEYMVPAAFVALEAMPLTPNGKVDRRALPAPDTSALASTATFVAPETPTAELLAAIWCEVLGLKNVGIHDNFFELGGHSLLATQVISRIRLVFSVEVPLAHVFEFPTLATLSKAIEAQADSGWQAPAIVRVSRDAAIGLSFAQERLWFLNQLEGQSATYNIPGALGLDGQVAVAALEQAITEIVRRHEALRTRFTNNLGTPVQIIAPAAPVTVPVIDLQDITEEKQAIVVLQLATEEGQRPFDLSGELLLRVKLLRLSAESHVLLLTMHHIVSDGWSIGVFGRELQTLYQAFAQGVASPLPELPIQYADFAVWQRQWLSGEVLDIQLSYWKQQLAGVPTLLELPTDRPRPSVQTFRGRRESFKLDEKLTDRLKQASRRAGVTLFMTLLAAFATLLYRYSGQEDIVIGSPIANRNRSQIEPLIGFFVNTLALRITLEKNPSFASLLSQVRKVCLEAYGHQDLPFEVLVDALQPTRNLSITPLFQVMFAMQNGQSVELDLPGIKCEMLAVESGVAKFDMTLSMAETSQGITGDIEYNSDLFDGARIRSMIGHFGVLLEAIVRHPEARVDQLPLLSELERHQLLVEWNETATDYPSDKCIHQLFEEQVERTPDAVAVVFASEKLTYRELNGRANKLAHYLRSLGVGAEVLVGICVERSIEMVVGLLGILKAGGAYVPLDPAYPPDRIAYMLSDAQVPVLLTLSKLVDSLTSSNAKVVCLDVHWGAIAPGNEQNNHYSCLPTSLAYVLYTSGSTGLPKGVAIEHSSVVALLSWAQESFTAFQLAGVLASTSICFDLSVFELFLPISCGGKIILAKSALDLPSLPAASDVTIINTVPSALAELLRMKGIPPRVRTVNLAGEPLKKQLVELLYNQQTISEVYNLYGPSEDTTYSTFALVEKGASKAPHIGHPIDNTQTYILDNNLQPLPVGVPGELYIGGAGLARGYLNRPSLTLSKFIPNPFSNEPGDRLYKTGDRARYRTDGNIEFLGRIDNQVKIRGFRIELGEIEATLAQHPGVVQAVVIAREDIPGDKRLVAYIVGKTEPPTARELRDFLKAKLPGYMVPAAFVTLEAMPLTPNGKVDRRALLALAPSNITSTERFVAPRTPTEEILATIWSKILGVPRIGIHDNFFELGGDSILTIGIISQAARAGLKITPKQMFQYQTIAELADVASVVTQTEKTAQQKRVTGVVPLTPIQHWFFSQKLPEPHHYNQSVLLEVSPDTKPERLQQAVEQMNEHHDALRLRFVLDDGKIEQINADEEKTVPFNVVDLSEVDEQQAVMEQTVEKLHRSLNLSEGPLMQAAWFKLGIDKPGRLLLVIHHLAVDGVSWRILLEDLVNAYRGNQLPVKTTSFQDWAVRLTEYAASGIDPAELDYWRAQSGEEIASLPVDYNNLGANTFASTANVSISLTVEETQTLLKEVPQAYNTQINDVLLTALVQSFSWWTGKPELLVDLEGHGRSEMFEEVDLSRTVGWFTTIFPVILKLENSHHPSEALKSVKEQLRKIPQRGIGYGILRYLSKKSSLRSQLEATPQAEVSFNYLGQFDQMVGASPLCGFAKESPGQGRSQKGLRKHLLEVNGLVKSGALQVNWTYSENFHKPSTVEGLARGFREALKSLIAHCSDSEAGGYTPSDFAKDELSQEEIDDILAAIEY